MRVFLLIIFLGLFACSKNNDYDGQSAWAKYHEKVASNKRPVKSAYPGASERHIIPEQRITSVSEENDFVSREAPKVIRIGADSTKTISEVPEIAIKNNEKIHMQEEYFSAAGSKCKRTKSEFKGEMSAKITCKYPDGREFYFNDLTM